MSKDELVAIRRGAFFGAIAAIKKDSELIWRTCDYGEKMGMERAIRTIEKLMSADDERIAEALAAA